MEKLKFAIVGCGTIAGFHAQAIKRIAGAELVCAHDAVPAMAQKFGETHGVKIYDTFEELLNGDADIINLCTPSGMHSGQAAAAAARGKHVVVEKPMAITVAGAEEVIEACDKYDVKLTVISQLRFTKSAQRIKAAIDGGRLGRLVNGSAYMKYYRSPEYYAGSNWRGTWALDGGGALMNQGIHGVDLLQYIMGPVKSVCGYARTLARDIETEDTAVAALEFVNGAIGVIEGTTSVYPGYSRRLSFSGDKGTIILEEDSIAEWSILGEETPPEVTASETTVSSHNNPTAINIEYHITQLQDMADAVRTGRKPFIDEREGIKAVQIIRAVYESSESGKIIYL